MSRRRYSRRLVGATVWVVLLLIALGLLVDGRMVGLSPSAAALASIPVLWAASVLPNVTEVWGLRLDDGSAWRRRIRRILALVFAAVGGALAFLRTESPTENGFITCLTGSGFFGLLGYAIGDQILPRLRRPSP